MSPARFRVRTDTVVNMAKVRFLQTGLERDDIDILDALVAAITAERRPFGTPVASKLSATRRDGATDGDGLSSPMMDLCGRLGLLDLPRPFF